MYAISIFLGRIGDSKASSINKYDLRYIGWNSISGGPDMGRAAMPPTVSQQAPRPDGVVAGSRGPGQPHQLPPQEAVGLGRLYGQLGRWIWDEFSLLALQHPSNTHRRGYDYLRRPEASYDLKAWSLPLFLSPAIITSWNGWIFNFLCSPFRCWERCKVWLFNLERKNRIKYHTLCSDCKVRRHSPT